MLLNSERLSVESGKSFRKNLKAAVRILMPPRRQREPQSQSRTAPSGKARIPCDVLRGACTGATMLVPGSEKALLVADQVLAKDGPTI
jgi:hypothetical protein